MTRRLRASAHHPLGRDAGVTLVELMVTVILIGVAGTLGVVSLASYGKAQDQQQTANQLVSDLRKAGQQALSEGRTYCVALSDAADTWTVSRKDCAGASSTPVEGPTKAQGQVTLGTLTMSGGVTTGCPSGTCIYFKPRGTATQASVQVQRPGASSITITVEGLTGRVDRT